MNSNLDLATILIVRLESIKELMERAQRSAADVHEMDNLRYCAVSALDLIKCDRAEAEVLEALVSRLERRSVEFFKKRYSDVPK